MTINSAETTADEDESALCKAGIKESVSLSSRSRSEVLINQRTNMPQPSSWPVPDLQAFPESC
jgi:hypothetical protein